MDVQPVDDAATTILRYTTPVAEVGDALALVVRDLAARSEAFQQFAAEARHGRQFRTFDDEAGAVRWLEGEERGTDTRTRYEDEGHGTGAAIR